jgi:hypothetical protein
LYDAGIGHAGGFAREGGGREPGFSDSFFPIFRGAVGFFMNESEPPSQRNIVLVGFMGSGKSTIARVLHQRLGYPLVEMDQVTGRAGGEGDFPDL